MTWRLLFQRRVLTDFFVLECFPFLGRYSRQVAPPEHLGVTPQGGVEAFPRAALLLRRACREFFRWLGCASCLATAWVACQPTAARFAVLPVFAMHSWG